MGLEEMVIMMGTWSEAVAGPGVKWMLWNILKLARAMSGVVVQLCLIRVGKLGPKCCSILL